MLDENYRPIGGEGAEEPRPPLYPSRLRALIYTFAQFAYEDEVKLAGGKLQKR